MPFIAIYAHGCGYLRRLIQDKKIHNEARGKTLFGLFDFDEAYNEWNRIGGTVELDDPYKGMIKKLNGKNGYAYLLPVPDNDDIKRQVIKNESTSETFLHKSILSMELLFYGYKITKDYFTTEPSPAGGTKIIFKGDKDKFAKEIIPTLPTEAFTLFSPIFSHIESHI